MAQSNVEKINLNDAFMFHDITGHSFQDLQRILDYPQVEALIDVIEEMDLRVVHDVILGGAVSDDDATAGLAGRVEKRLRNAYYNMTKSDDWDDNVDLEKVKADAVTALERQKKGLDSEVYTKCLAALVWIWESKGEGGGVSFAEFKNNYSQGELLEKFWGITTDDLEGTDDSADSGDAVPLAPV